jgi:glycerophosphoryl diester phosphodiesterase
VESAERIRIPFQQQTYTAIHPSDPMLKPQRESFLVYWRNRYDFIRFAILFRLFEAFIFTPLMAFAGHFLSGRVVVDSTDLVGFALSPRGCLATLVGATLLLTIRLVEQTGLSTIALGAIGGARVTAPAALRVVAQLLPRLLAVAARILLAGLALMALSLIVAAWLARDLLVQHDINYYLAELPPEFLTAAAVIMAVAIPTLAVAVWLAVRWRFVVPVALCELANSREVLRSSARLAHGHWRRTATAWLGTALVVLCLGLLAAWLGRLCSLGTVLLTGNGLTAPISVFAGLVVVRTLVAGFVTMPGPCLSAGVFATLYCDFRRDKEPDWNPAFSGFQAGTEPSRWRAAGRYLLALLPLIMVGMALGSTVMAMGELDRIHPVAVTAHRGGTQRSIENTLRAVQEAIDVGAQFAEIDVQMSRDEVLVVTHDSDFSRQARIAKKVWDLSCDEIRQIPLTRAESPEIAADHVPLFDEVLELARGRIRLNVELKYYGDHQPRLAERVVAAIQAKSMADQLVIQSLHYAGLEDVRRLAPEIPIGYLFSVNAREPKRLEVDFLSVQVGRANGSFINAAHRRKQEVHVWTVDKRSDMQRMIDLGVDNLITNHPQQALELVREHNQLSASERALHQVRIWLTE